MLNATNRLPKKIKEKPLSEIYPNIVNELINQHLIIKQAYKDKLDQQKEIIEILKKNKGISYFLGGKFEHEDQGILEETIILQIETTTKLSTSD